MGIFDHVDPADAREQAEEMRRQVEQKKEQARQAKEEQDRIAREKAEKRLKDGNGAVDDRPWVEAHDIASAFGMNKDK